MQKIRTFWHAFKHSLIPVDQYYRKILKTPFRFSVKYYIALILIVVTITTVAKATVFIVRYPPNLLTELLQEAEESYPDDLVISINELGRLSTNAEKPYILFSPIDKNPMPLVVVDPKAQDDKIFEYDSNVLFTETRMIVRADSMLYTFTYDVNSPMRITRSDIEKAAINADVILDSYWIFALSILIGVILVAPLLVFIGQTLMLIIAAFIFFILLKFVSKKRNITYQKIFQISLHTITGPMVIQGILFTFGLYPVIEYWYIILTYIFLAGGIFEAYFEKSAKR